MICKVRIQTYERTPRSIWYPVYDEVYLATDTGLTTLRRSLQPAERVKYKFSELGAIDWKKLTIEEKFRIACELEDGEGICLLGPWKEIENVL